MTLLAWLFGLIVLIVAIAVGGRLPEPLLPQDLARRRADPHRLRRPEDRAHRRHAGAAVPAQGRRDQHADDADRGQPRRRQVADHRRPHAGRRRARVLPARAADRRRRRAPRRRRSAPKSLSPDGVRNLLEGRFIDAIQATGAGLHDGFAARQARRVRAHDPRIGAREPRHSGLQLESVSLTRMDQAAFAALDDNNAFNAVGLRKLAEIIATSKKKRAEIEADADVSVRQTQLEAIKQRLGLCAPGRGSADRPAPRDREAQGGERRRHRAGARAVDGRSEAARIEREQATRVAEIQKARELRRLEIEAQLSSEVRKIDSSIAMRAASTPRKRRRRRRPSSRAPRSSSRRSSCRPSASARSPTARARSRSSASRSAARSRPRRPRARPRCC